jgi:hypothetical protein
MLRLISDPPFKSTAKPAPIVWTTYPALMLPHTSSVYLRDKLKEVRIEMMDCEAKSVDGEHAGDACDSGIAKSVVRVYPAGKGLHYHQSCQYVVRTQQNRAHPSEA